MPTTTNNRRAYIRRYLAIAWSSLGDGAWEKLNIADCPQIGTDDTVRKGLEA